MMYGRPIHEDVIALVQEYEQLRVSIPNGEYPKSINAPAYVPPYEVFPDPPSSDNHLPETIHVTVGDEIALNTAVASYISETRNLAARPGDVWRVIATDSENGAIIEYSGRSVELNKSLALTLQPVRIIR